MSALKPPPDSEAVVRYLPGDLHVLKPGTHVRCAVSGVPIALQNLRYWCAERQEAYASPREALTRHGAARSTAE